MRPKFFPILALLPFLLLAGCDYDDSPGINRTQAISAAERHCADFPGRYSYVRISAWSPRGNCWAVVLSNRGGSAGWEFKISRHGAVLDSRRFGPEQRVAYYRVPREIYHPAYYYNEDEDRHRVRYYGRDWEYGRGEGYYDRDTYYGRDGYNAREGYGRDDFYGRENYYGRGHWYN